jgi:hypothetical protein
MALATEPRFIARRPATGTAHNYLCVCLAIDGSILGDHKFSFSQFPEVQITLILSGLVFNIYKFSPLQQLSF